ncbi:hypothetical protein ACQJBY_000472 [Aegilops geniculata]
MESNLELEEIEAQNTEFSQFNAMQGPIAVTSRISLQKICNTFSQFSEFKRNIMRDIGFGGALAIKTVPKLNLKFSSCLMERVNPDTREILIDDDRAIKFSPRDVGNVFGIPCGEKKISTYPTELSEACAGYKKFAEEMSDKGTHSLKAAEAMLLKPLDADSPAIDIDMFKVAAVIFIVGHMLCPSSKNDYTTVDYWEALSRTSEIREYNWCEFVIEHLLAAVRKLKSDLQTRHSTIHLVGCHLFLQVFVLDNLELGPLTRRVTSYPRISFFDYDTIRKMIDSLNISQSGEPTFIFARGFRPDDVGYSRCFIIRASNQQHGCLPITTHAEQNNMFKTPENTSRQYHPSTTSNPMVRATSRKGPSDFARHLREHYPDLVSDPIAIFLREHNARVIRNMFELQQKYHEEITAFADKVMTKLSQRENSVINNEMARGSRSYVQNAPLPNMNAPPLVKASSVGDGCSATRSNSRDSLSCKRKLGHVTPADSIDTAGSASSATHNSGPVGWQWKKARIQQPDFSDDADIAIGVDETPSKTMPTPKSQSKEIANELAITTQFAIDIIEELTLLYADKHPACCESAITFGQYLTGHVEKMMLGVSNIARDPWASGSVPYPPSPTAAAVIKDWFSRAPPSTLARKWVIHVSPRLIHMDGSQLHEQIIGGKPLSHELCAVIMRRFGQIDSVLCRDAVGMRWRKFMEPDIAVSTRHTFFFKSCFAPGL